MSDLLFIKQALHIKLNELLNEKIVTVRQEMIDTSDSMMNDTKSSAGDKFETSREMIQQELDNIKAQLDKLLHLKKDLSQIDLNKVHDKIGFGSLVLTSNGNYFVSAAMGKVFFETTEYYALSLASPLGTAMKGAKVGDEIQFQGKAIQILNLV